MSIATVVTRGYGSFGSVNKLPTLGYSVGAAAAEIHPGDARFSRAGVASVSVSRRGPGDAVLTRSGVGAATIGRKQS